MGFFYRWIDDYRIEFILILSWMLFFPEKQSNIYFTGSAILICFFALRKIHSMKTIGVSSFSLISAIIHFFFIFLTFFSVYHFKSILLLSDLLIISCYFTLFYNSQRSERNLIPYIFSIISVFSVITIIMKLIPSLSLNHPLFVNTIHEGIISGMGVLLAVYYLMNKRVKWYWIGLIINTVGVYISKSKGAFLGVILFSILLILAKWMGELSKKKRIWVFIGAVGLLIILPILTFFIPNPMQSSFKFSLEKDPYVLERLKIWEMTPNIFKDYWLTGVGLDNFSTVCSRYNFKQIHGPANYFKLPTNTHNDYFQLVTETGIGGILLILLLGFVIVRNLFSTALFNISKIIILFLLFQALFFNLLFYSFFYFLFIFFLKEFLEEKIIFKSFPFKQKLLLGVVIVFIFIGGYLSPSISGFFLDKAGNTTNPIEKFNLLKKAVLVNPLDVTIYQRKAIILETFFNKSTDMDAFYEGINQLKKAEYLNPYFIDPYLTESSLYIDFLKKKVKYISMDDEIIAPLKKAEIYAPFNPFIKLTKAEIYLEFDKREKAKSEALNAFNLEPEYVGALYFLQRYFNYFGDKKSFQKRIDGIREKAVKLNPANRHYLYILYQIPVWGNNL